MSQHLNIYSQRGCLGCKPCEGGAANVGRWWALFALIFFTAGVGALVLPFYKRCQFCGHNSIMNRHASPTQQYSQQVPTAVP